MSVVQEPRCLKDVWRSATVDAGGQYVVSTESECQLSRNHGV